MSKTKNGYNHSCQRLVSQNVTQVILPQSFPSRLWNIDPVVTAHRLGFELSLDLRDNLQRCIYFTGKYEPQTLTFICSELQIGDTFIDVGAHIGIHSLVAVKKLKELGDGKVIAFEPTQDSSQKLLINAKANNYDIELHKIALGDETTEIPIFGDSDWGVHDAGVRSFFGNGQMIQMVKVDKFDNWNKKYAINRIDIIKIDAEGAEYEILKGMSESILKYRPRCIIFEIKESLLRKAGKNISEILNLMKDLGYQPEGQVFEGNQVFRQCSSSL
ncbi:FkbM family methyltransferase [Halotia wernerae UHCC 0503]|nr:FkbM family methyltransferase [Halotia wernerae UHCC 0503]